MQKLTRTGIFYLYTFFTDICMYCPRKFPKFSETVKLSRKILKNVKNIASNVKFANFLYFCSTQEKVLPHFHIVVTLFRAQYKSIENSQALQGYIFHILKYFTTKLDNCIKFRMLFPAVLIDFPNAKVCLIGEWSISCIRCDFLFN